MPTIYEAAGGSESHVQQLHAGEGEYAVEASPRLVQCVLPMPLWGWDGPESVRS